MLRGMLARARAVPFRPTVLGRWCHPEYSATCDPDKKADLATWDTGAGGDRIAAPLVAVPTLGAPPARASSAHLDPEMTYYLPFVDPNISDG